MMDLRADGWKARVKISGISKPLDLDGSVARIIQQLVPYLTTVQGIRQNSQGAKTIHIELTTGKLGEQQTGEANPIEAFLTEGVEDGSIKVLSEDAIQQMMQPWQADPKWQRFHELQASQAAFAMSIDEYEGLWQYVQATWPEYAKNVKRKSL